MSTPSTRQRCRLGRGGRGGEAGAQPLGRKTRQLPRRQTHKHASLFVLCFSSLLPSSGAVGVSVHSWGHVSCVLWSEQVWSRQTRQEHVSEGTQAAVIARPRSLPNTDTATQKKKTAPTRVRRYLQSTGSDTHPSTPLASPPTITTATCAAAQNPWHLHHPSTTSSARQ